MKAVLASKNAHKLEEISKIVAQFGMELVLQSELGIDVDVEETGTTFEENSMLKARAVMEASGLPAIADDSGLMVDALGGEPGVYSARYGPGHDASDADRYNYLLNKLGDEKNRSARFVCCICCTMPDGTVLRSRGECEGEIMHGPKGDGGFGYDPVFKPDAVERGMAELTPDEKNAISHRGKALRAFAEELKRYYNGNNK